MELLAGEFLQSITVRDKKINARVELFQFLPVLHYLFFLPRHFPLRGYPVEDIAARLEKHEKEEGHRSYGHISGKAFLSSAENISESSHWLRIIRKFSFYYGYYDKIS